eukprot:COSAG06_NODE_5879_length_3231_cov_1.840677_2_plen_87_part_00
MQLRTDRSRVGIAGVKHLTGAALHVAQRGVLCHVVPRADHPVQSRDHRRVCEHPPERSAVRLREAEETLQIRATGAGEGGRPRDAT